MEKHSLLALWQWWIVAALTWSRTEVSNCRILLCQHGESCIEIVEVLWKWCMLCFSPLKNLCCTMQSHLTFQLVTHIVLLCCMIMCGLSFIQGSHLLQNGVIIFLHIMWHHITVMTSRLCSRTVTGKSMHILHTVQPLLLMISFCFLTWRNLWIDAGWICRHPHHCYPRDTVSSEQRWILDAIN